MIKFIKKNWRIILLLIIVLFVISKFSSCQRSAAEQKIDKAISEYQNQITNKDSEISKLKSEKAELNDTVSSLESTINSHENLISELRREKSSLKNYDDVDNNSYLRIKFYEDGKIYQINSESPIYSDPYLTKETDLKQILSPVIDQVELSNGNTVYAAMSTDGLIYSSELYISEIESDEDE